MQKPYFHFPVLLLEASAELPEEDESQEKML